MRRFNLFLIFLVTSLIALTVLIVAGIFIFNSAQQSPYNWVTGMMGGGSMMGGTGQPTAQNSALPIFGVAFVILVSIAVVGMVGMVYYVVLPEIRSGTAPVVCETVPQGNTPIVDQQPTTKPKAECTPLDSVVKTLSEEERKVVEVLNAHDGKYLQKYIRIEAGLSRLKTHRIVARLAERGIVALEKMGNTNQVLLADWLKK
jgi:uncharacterized membrane protein